MYFLRVQIVILLYGITQVYGFIHLRYEDFEFKKTVALRESACRDLPESWIEQPLDHFNESDRRTFKMKYIKMLDSWKTGGPIVFYLNGEAPLTQTRVSMVYTFNPEAKSRSLIEQIVEETGAALFMLEHRYYGDSVPYDDLSTENLAYLSSRQAISDAAHLLVTIKESPDFKDSKIIIIGGSYAGNLAAWMRLLYPSLVDAALASSAPVLAKANFNEYYEQVTETFIKYRPQDCITRTIERFNTYRKLLKSPKGIRKLKKQNGICKSSDMSDSENQQLSIMLSQQTMMLSPYAHEAQYRSPDKASRACKMNLKNIVNKGFDCFHFDHELYELDSETRSWFYQTCTEFGYFQSAESSKTMFGNVLSVDFYYNTCKNLFGEEFDEERVKQGVINTNRMYGGLTPNVTKVVFVHGDMDPWHTLGILHDLSPDAPSIYIEGTSHCADLNHPRRTDNKNLRTARIKIKSLLKKWIGVP